MAKPYTIKEAIGEMDTIRMEANTVPSLLGGGDKIRELSRLVSELASVIGWLARHVDEFESETLSEILFYTDDGPVRKSELFEVGTLDGKNAHPGMKPAYPHKR